MQSLLRLTLNGDEAAFDETKAPEGQQRLIAATEGARDLGELARAHRGGDRGGACYIPAHRRGAGARRRLETAQRGKGSDR